MRLNIYHLLFIGIILLGSCKPKRATLEFSPIGSYVGMSPCHNCRGVYTKVIFQSDSCMKMTSEPDDYEALRGRTGRWKMGSDRMIICTGLGRDTLYFRYLSEGNIMLVYKDRENQNQLKDGYILKKDTIF